MALITNREAETRKLSCMRFLILLTILASFTAQANDNWLWWKAGLGAWHMQDNLSESRVAGLYLTAKSKYRLGTTVTAFAEIGAQLETGSSQSIFSEEFRPQEKVYIHEANIRYIPFRFLALRLGVLNQDLYESPLLFNEAAFPAIRESILIPLGIFRARLIAQQAVPTSQSLATRTAAKKEGTPFVLTNSAIFSLVFEQKYFVEGQATHYQFRNLPPAVANESRFLGNSVTGVSVTNARFNFDFAGWNFAGKVGYREGTQEYFAVGGEFINNNEGPVGDNSGLRGWVRFGFPVGNTFLQPEAGYFRNESDTSPAFYNSKYYGHNNRRGYFVALTSKLPDYSFTVKGIKADLINSNALQADRFMISFLAETRFHAI